jgi:hypothetical protein
MEMNETEKKEELIKEFVKGKKIKKVTVTKALKEARKKVHKEVYGDD